jgi:hypothetical protein
MLPIAHEVLRRRAYPLMSRFQDRVATETVDAGRTLPDKCNPTKCLDQFTKRGTDVRVVLAFQFDRQLLAVMPSNIAGIQTCVWTPSPSDPLGIYGHSASVGGESKACTRSFVMHRWSSNLLRQIISASRPVIITSVLRHDLAVHPM